VPLSSCGYKYREGRRKKGRGRTENRWGSLFFRSEKLGQNRRKRKRRGKRRGEEQLQRGKKRNRIEKENRKKKKNKREDIGADIFA
jgi:hypothetical protein